MYDLVSQQANRLFFLHLTRDFVKSLCNEDDWEVSDESDGEADSKPELILL